MRGYLDAFRDCFGTPETAYLVMTILGLLIPFSFGTQPPTFFVAGMSFYIGYWFSESLSKARSIARQRMEGSPNPLGCSCEARWKSLYSVFDEVRENHKRFTGEAKPSEVP